MRKVYYLFLLFLCCAISPLFAQECSVIISASDSLICSGDAITLNAVAVGPEDSLEASNTAGNNHRGNMFDIVATNAVTILSFDASPMGNTTIEVYYKTGTWNGFANTPSAWTFVGSAPVTAVAGFSPVAVPVNVTIPAGQTYAFYVTSNSTAVSLNYSNGSAVGNVYSSDANISFIEGGGMEYPFTNGTNAVYQPRVWNGRIHYGLANMPGSTLTWGGGETTTALSASPTSTTQYTVSATVPGCASTMYDTLEVSVSIPVVDAGMDRSICIGDTVMLYGAGAESYSWDNGVTDSVQFVPGATMNYTVMGTDSAGCTDADQVLITVNALPNVFAGNDTPICVGDSITLAGSGASTYTWDNGITDNVAFQPASSATYTVTGTDANGCMNTDDVWVSLHAHPVVYAGPDMDLCQGEEYTLNGSGALTYSWDNGVTDGQPFVPMNTTYTVVGTDATGCTGTDEVTITLHNVMASIFASGSTLSAGVLVDMTAQWIDCSDLSTVPGETDAAFEPVVGGSYAIVVMDNVYGCVDTSNCLSVTFAGLEEFQASDLSAYPVPANDKVSIASTGSAIERIELVDILGQVLVSAEPNELQTTLDLSGYAANTFVVRVYRQGNVSLLKIKRN